MLRLNMAIPPSATENPLGLVAGDAAGFPNGRRLSDDVVTIELRAMAGLTIPLVDPSFTPDGAAAAIADGTTNTNAGAHGSFPYLGLPGGGYQTGPARRRRHERRSRRTGTPTRTRTPARGWSSSTSGVTSAPSW